MSVKESGIQGRISHEILEAYGNRVRVRVRHGSQYATAGDPDLEGCLYGLYFAFEVKNEKGDLTKIQMHRLKEITDAGGIAAGVRSPREALDILKTAVIIQIDNYQKQGKWHPAGRIIR